MSPLRVEVLNQQNQWVQVGSEIKPGGPVGSISNNKHNGTREIYLLSCAPDNSKSIIYRSGFGTDIDLGPQREVLLALDKLEVVKELKKGESYEMFIKTDRSPEPRKIRFSHG